MYPSEKDPVYGTFVKEFVEGVAQIAPCWEVNKVVIKGRSKHVWVKIFKYISFYSSIFYRLFFGRYDYVYVHLITHAALPLRIVSFIKTLPLVFNVHGEDLLTQSRLAAYFLKLVIPLLKKAHLIVIPSEYFKMRFQEVLPMIPENKLYVSPSGGIDTDLFTPCTRKKSSVYTIGYVSRIDRGKGWDTLLEAVALLVERNYNVKVIIAGRGAETPMLKKSICRLKLENIVYLGGVPHARLSEVYNKMDVFVFPTKLEESLGLVGLEAMACGVPVIASRIGGLTDYIQERVNGCFFEPGVPISLAEAIMWHISNEPVQKEALKAAAVQTAKCYAKEKVLNQLCSQLGII